MSETDADALDRPIVPDGCGCIEIAEFLERRRDNTEGGEP